MRRWTLYLCASALLMGAAACSDDDDGASADGTSSTTASSTSSTTTTEPRADGRRDVMTVEGFSALEPGGYVIDPDGDPATPLTVTYDVHDKGWSQWLGAVKFYDTGHAGVSITTVTNVVRDGCEDHRPADPAVGPSVEDLATALTGLAPFEVTAPPSDVTKLGYRGKHLQLTVPDLPYTGEGADRLFSDCQEDSLHSWIAENNGGSFYGYNGEPGRTEDFWILDVDGTRLAIVTTSSPETTAADLAEMQAIVDSIQIET
ncbi:MAG: hypothetical protein ACJ739_16250 [Acidimicrobiales bacterium]